MTPEAAGAVPALVVLAAGDRGPQHHQDRPDRRRTRGRRCRLCGRQRTPGRHRRRDRQGRRVRVREVVLDQRRRREGRAARRRGPPRQRRAWRWSWAPTAATARCGSPAPRHRPRCSPSSCSAANAEVARRIWAHAGVDDRVTCVVGTIGDGGLTLDALASEHGFAAGKLDLLFIDHDKAAYLADLQSILRPRLAAPRIDRGRRQHADSGLAEVPRIHEASSRASCSTPSSTRRTASIRRWLPMSCWSRSI